MLQGIVQPKNHPLVVHYPVGFPCFLHTSGQSMDGFRTLLNFTISQRGSGIIGIGTYSRHGVGPLPGYFRTQIPQAFHFFLRLPL